MFKQFRLPFFILSVPLAALRMKKVKDENEGKWKVCGLECG